MKDEEILRYYGPDLTTSTSKGECGRKDGLPMANSVINEHGNSLTEP
jgi:hypothetical protein